MSTFILCSSYFFLPLLISSPSLPWPSFTPLSPFPIYPVHPFFIHLLALLSQTPFPAPFSLSWATKCFLMRFMGYNFPRIYTYNTNASNLMFQVYNCYKSTVLFCTFSLHILLHNLRIAAHYFKTWSFKHIHTFYLNMAALRLDHNTINISALLHTQICNKDINDELKVDT